MKLPTQKEYVSRIESSINTIFGAPVKGKQVDLSFRWDSIAEARQHLSHIRQLQKELRLIKKEANLTIKQIRLPFTIQRRTVAPSFFASAIGKGGSDVAQKRREISRKEFAATNPYVAVVQMIDQVLVTLDKAKLEIENWVATNI